MQKTENYSDGLKIRAGKKNLIVCREAQAGSIITI